MAQVKTTRSTWILDEQHLKWVHRYCVHRLLSNPFNKIHVYFSFAFSLDLAPMDTRKRAFHQGEGRITDVDLSALLSIRFAVLTVSPQMS
jgi:hypothetical protein